MKESLFIRMSESNGTFTVRSGGYKSTSNQSHHDAARRLISKICGYVPKEISIIREGELMRKPGVWLLSWEEAA